MDSVKKSQCCDQDRISNLPVHVAHHILSFLAMEELAGMCLTSKKHRELCISIPFLTIDGIPYKSSAKRVQFINFIDRLLSLRKGMETRRVIIRWSFENGNSNDEYRVLTWLNHAIGCKVKLLDLEFILKKDGVFFFPLCVFHCESLMELKVNLHGGIFKLPSTDGICKIQYFSLTGVQIFDQNFGEWVSSLCKHLKQLSLADIHGIKNISIESSSLQVLTIIAPSSGGGENDLCRITISAEMLKKLRLDWRFKSSIGKSLKIYAPNLVTFSWYGSFVSSFCLGNLKHLLCTSFRFYGPVNMNELSCSQNILELLQCMCTVKGLSLHDSTIMILPASFSFEEITSNFFKAPEARPIIDRPLEFSVMTTKKGGNSLSLSWRNVMVLFKLGCTPVLNNVKWLFITASYLSDDLIPAIACLLKHTPNLKYLSIRRVTFCSQISRNPGPFEAYGFTLGYWESRNLVFNQLKVAAIELCNKGANELEFIKFLLKHARVLEKLTVFDPPCFSSEISKVINDYQKVSSAEIVFNPKPSDAL